MAILSCLTRDDDIRAARRAQCCLLEEATALSADDAAAGNIAIQGDKLDALRALLSFCAGRRRYIHIAPKYNRRPAFQRHNGNLEFA